MYHHDGRDYRVAASVAAAKGRIKLEELVQRGKNSTEGVIAAIQSQAIRDKVAPANRIRLIWDEEAGNYRLATVTNEDHGYSYTQGRDDAVLHPHALDQVFEKAGVPKDFVNRLEKEAGKLEWGKKLIEDCVNTILANRPKDRHLIRTDDAAGGRIKGFLSDKFRRLDCRPMLDAFLGACVDIGLAPYEGVMSDTKCRVRAVLPHIFEPIPDEIMVFGVEFGNSDYGDGGVSLNVTCTRVWCTNLAVTEKSMRQVHLGPRLPDDIEMSEDTMRKDTAAIAGTVRDVVKGVLAPKRIDQTLELIKSASEKEIRSTDGIDKILSRLGKAEVEKVKAIYNSPDVVNLPAGQSYYRLSNALTWFAQYPEVGTDRKMELQDEAGKLLVPDRDRKKGFVEV